MEIRINRQVNKCQKPKYYYTTISKLHMDIIYRKRPVRIAGYLEAKVVIVAMPERVKALHKVRIITSM